MSSPFVEIAIQAVFLIAMSFLTIYQLQTAPPWVEPTLAVYMLVSSAIGISVGIRENQLKTGKRLLTVLLWCGVVSALCAVKEGYFPLPRMPGEPIELGREYPFALTVFLFVFSFIVFGFVGIATEEVTAFTRRYAIRWLSK